MLLALRPTLFDIVANDAISFHKSELNNGAVVPVFATTTTTHDGSSTEDGGDARAKALTSEVVDPARLLARRREFVEWSLPHGPDVGSEISILVLYQRLLVLHGAASSGSEALADVDIARCAHGLAMSAGDEGAVMYRARLADIAAMSTAPHGAARARYLWARSLADAGEFTEAHKIASAVGEAEDGDPGPIGAQQCRALVKEIEAPHLDMTVANVWQSDGAVVVASYKNLPTAHFRLVALSDDEAMACSVQRHDDVRKQWGKWAVSRAAKAWTATLKPTPDYKVLLARARFPPPFLLALLTQQYLLAQSLSTPSHPTTATAITANHNHNHHHHHYRHRHNRNRTADKSQPPTPSPPPNTTIRLPCAVTSPLSSPQATSTEIVVPGTVEPGYYAFLSSFEPTFGTSTNDLRVATVWVSLVGSPGRPCITSLTRIRPLALNYC
jgi:hypothetical protein